MVKDILNEINILENRLRALYRQLYREGELKVPIGHTKEELLPQLFDGLSTEEKESVWRSIAAVWGNTTTQMEISELQTIDSYRLATEWFKRPKYDCYAHLDISTHDVALVYRYFKHLAVARKIKEQIS